MASPSSQRKRVKTIGRKNMSKGSTLDEWINDDSAQLNFLDYWKMRRVKGVHIKLTDEAWTDIVGFKLGGEKTGGMKKDDRLAVFFISWILMSRGSNHAQETTEDLYLLKAIRENIQADWPAAISDNMLKVTKFESAMLPYCVFISKVLIHLGVECINESSESYGRTNMIDKSALHCMGLQHTPDGWEFKNEFVEEDNDVAESSSIRYRPRSEFKKFMLKEIRSLKIVCQGIRKDVLVIKEHLNLNAHNEESEPEESSGGEGSTPVGSAIDDMEEEEEGQDDNVEEESNSDMILRTYLKKKNRKKT
ncbi:hypothetical protein LR48_Vigan07g202500 [Vigna angularis]|uniref:Uncharacterized protein n=1 Tax=Phaseolus angularis TaxID=3914 RepID=A0A0L9V039_PHAAN|nr:hypothetical protein LR48_Vigan07g202500 [Vigna angularis]